MNNKTVLLTGATGLVGSYLLKILLHEGYKIYALARGKNNKSARERVLDILNFWDKDLFTRRSNSLIVLEGDITEKNFGFDKHTIDLLIKEVEEIFHSAAATRFNWPLKEIRKVNVKGTKTVLDFAVKCSKQNRFKKVNHISTAYICGNYNGTFSEVDLDLGQSFSSTYEQSKFEAEKIVEEYRKKGLWVDIYRPPLVIGESDTGKTITFNQSVYQLLHMLSLKLFDYFPAKGIHLNIVFVDDLCAAIYKISSKTSAINKNYHPFYSSTFPFSTILDISSNFLKFPKPALVSRDNFLNNNSTPAQRILLQNNILIISNSVRLNSTLTNKTLRHYDFGFSNLNINSFLNQLRYCIANNFLRINNKENYQ